MAAHQTLVRHTRTYPDLHPLDIDETALSPRDAALAAAIVDAALRRWLTLACVFEGVLGREWSAIDPASQAALLAGGAQLLFLDRIPAHAAIHETVDVTKATVSLGAGRFVNAALRGLVREAFGVEDPAEGQRAERIGTWSFARNELPLAAGGAIVLRRDLLPEDELRRAAAATSHPLALLKHWEASHGRERALAMARHNVLAPPLVLTTTFATRPLPEWLAPHDDPTHHVLEAPARDKTDLDEPSQPPAHEPREALSAINATDPLAPAAPSALSTLLSSRRDLWVQDASAFRAAALLSDPALRDKRPDQARLIVDACAGQGTKSRQLAMACPNATIIATDADDTRMRGLRAVARLHSNIRVVAFESLDRNARDADVVLLDVPCSNTGVLCRRPEARYRAILPGQRDRLSNLQRRILERGHALLRSGGVLLYSTCSVEPWENEEQVQWACDRLALSVLASHRLWPACEPGDPAARYRDGAFAAALG
jgi:16S rRNA (cytosine967-C5)-methyltransferase